ncbi:MAG: sulfatase-like hydrolase/transferase [Verrucomicrobia bacterium]|nr:sulfatase-like hydrolase/transferase [Verrucomicrobiota bacterium]
MLPPPNLLWIVTTQWRGRAWGGGGDRNARTPHLDALAQAGVNYRQAVTPHPFGPFARAALLTGLPSPQNGVRDYFDPLPANARTIAHALRARGYATAFFGKWHLAARARDGPLVGEAHAKMVVPADARGGFEFWEGFEGGFLTNDPWLHGSRIALPMRFEGYQSDVVCGRAAAWAAAAGDRKPGDAHPKTQPGNDRPWFCVVSLEPPHPPYAAPAAGVVAREPRTLELEPNVPRGGGVEARARQELAGYYAHIEATDRAIGRLIAALDQEETRRGRPVPIVVFTSVHGDMHGAHGLFRKGWPHEESVRVPLVIRAPMVGDRGRTDDRAASLVDLAEMTLAWADGRTPDTARPHSLISMPGVVALPHQCDRLWRGVRTKSRKLVLNPDGSPWLFFDLERDAWERENLAGDPARADEIDALRGQAGLGA